MPQTRDEYEARVREELKPLREMRGTDLQRLYDEDAPIEDADSDDEDDFEDDDE